MTKHNEGETALQFETSKQRGLRVQECGAKSRPIGPYLEFRGVGKEENGDNYLAVIRFLDDNTGKVRRLIIPKADLINDDVVQRDLVGLGYKLPGTKKDQHLLCTYLREARSTRQYRIVGRTGWCSGAFITARGEKLGSNPHIIYKPAIPPRARRPSSGGTLEGWCNGVAKPAVHSQLVLFAISASLASLLLRVSGDESGVFHLFSKSSSGKTLTELVGLSVHGWSRREDLLHWDATETGLDELAAEHCDRLLVLDDTGHLADAPRTAAAKAQKLSYKITAGTGRLRSAYFGRAGNLCRWRLIVLSSGEVAVSELAGRAGEKRLKGSEVRMIDIPADSKSGQGIFNGVPKQMTPAKLAHQIEAACRRNYGHAAQKFIKGMLADGDKLTAKRIRLAKKRFFNEATVPKESWERRFAQRFALAYAAASIAIRYKIVPWQKEFVLGAIVSVYRAAREAVPDYEKSVALATRAIRRKLKAGRRLIDLREGHKPNPKILNNRSDGFIKMEEGAGLFAAVKPKALQRWVGDSLNLAWIGGYLRDEGHLVTTSRNLPTKQVMVPGIKGRRSYYCFRESFWAGT
jgi:putative DNA primase/helicase